MKANAKVMMVEVIEGLASFKTKDGLYRISSEKVAELQQAVEESEKFAVLEKDDRCYIVYKSKMRPSGAIAEYQVVKYRKRNVNKEAAKATEETKAKRVPKEKPEGLMGLTIAELRQKSKELGLPYMHKHRALNKATLVANIEAAAATA